MTCNVFRGTLNPTQSVNQLDSTPQTASRLVSVVFAGLKIVTDRQTDTPRYSVCNNRLHLRSSEMQANNK